MSNVRHKKAILIVAAVSLAATVYVLYVVRLASDLAGGEDSCTVQQGQLSQQLLASSALDLPAGAATGAVMSRSGCMDSVPTAAKGFTTALPQEALVERLSTSAQTAGWTMIVPAESGSPALPCFERKADGRVQALWLRADEPSRYTWIIQAEVDGDYHC